MQIKLAENIKKYRKEMDLTQERLADTMGVTVGAVSKWENGSNIPDIQTMMELANLFNISLDEFVGFDMSSKKIEDMCKNIDDLSFDHHFEEAIKEAKDAISRYPHTFKVLYTCGDMYYRKILEGLEMDNVDNDDVEKAIEIYQTALNHLDQNKDPEVSDYTIKTRLAHMYSLIDSEKALELLNEINYNGCHNNEIALLLLEMGKTTEALDKFTYALVQNFLGQTVISSNTAWALVETDKKSNLKKATELIDSQIALINAYSYQDKVDYMYKLKIQPLISKACFLALLGEENEMKKVISETYQLAKEFDNADTPRDITDFFKFYFTTRIIPIYDSCSEKAMESVEVFLQKKIKDSKGKQKKSFQKVLDYWNAIKEL